MRPLLFLSLMLSSAAPAFAERIVLVAGGGTEERSGVAATEVKLREPFGVDFDRAGNLFIVEMDQGNRLWRVATSGGIAQVAGALQAGDAGDGGAPAGARFNGPHTLVLAPDDRVLLADTWNGRIRAVDLAAGRVSTLAGYGVPAAEARARGPYCIALEPSGRAVLIADLQRVLSLDLASGKLTVVAGNGQKGVPRDGSRALESPLVDPRAAAMDRKGNVYILERNGHALRVVATDGTIRTVVNASGKRGAEGDGGDALAATLNGPKHLCIDRDDTVLIADAENNLIRRYVPATEKILRVAGTGKRGAAGLGGPPEQCELARPHGVTVHRDGTLYITDSYNDRVLKIVK